MPPKTRRTPSKLPAYRLYIRPIVGCIAPFAITVYFWVIWYLYLTPSHSADGLRFGRPGANTIYYSWFFLATLGLNISQYGLESVERSLVHGRPWQPIGGVQVKEHYHHTWARPDGWLRVARRVIFKDDRPIKRALTLWTILAIITFSGFLGLPLSGLAMAFDSGYLISGAAPPVVGYTNNSWNSRSRTDIIQRASAAWSSVAVASPPGAGVVYTAANFDRKTLSSLTTAPNVLSGDMNITGFFLAPQAAVPMRGVTWGLNFGYECSIVRDLSDLSILSNRTAVQAATSWDVSGKIWGNEDGLIRIYNVPYDYNNAIANIQGLAEVGYSDPDQTLELSAPWSLPECYEPLQLDALLQTLPYPGLNQPQVLEVLLWQNMSLSTPIENPPTMYYSLNDTIRELCGTHNATREGSDITTAMNAIGVRCSSVSEVGTANIDGRLRTFSHFSRSNSTEKRSKSNFLCALRLSAGVPQVLFHGLGSHWLSDFYKSVGKFPQPYSSGLLMSGHKDNHSNDEVFLQNTYLQATELRSSILSAYAHYALQLEYNGGVGYVDSNGTYVTSNHTNLDAIAYKLSTVLVPGVVPPILVASLLTFWAVGSTVLSLMYGFRKRETE